MNLRTHYAHHSRMPEAGSRRATNVTLPDHLIRDARALGVNLSQASEAGIAMAVATERRRRWLEANRTAFDAWNEYVAANGIPLE